MVRTENSTPVESFIAERAFQHAAALGEGPTWDDAARTLLWVDILGGDVHRFDPATGENVTLALGRHVGAAKPMAGGGLAVNLDVGVAVVHESLRLQWLTYWPRTGYRGNDAAVDAKGRLWAGTMPYDETRGGGVLYRVDGPARSARKVEDVGVSNGIAWSPDNTSMYFADSPTQRVDVFDFDLENGELSNRRPFIQITEPAIFPDGIYCDADGSLWVALYGGHSVRRYDATGRLTGEVALPTVNVTACAFGGPDLTDLYITTASETPSRGPSADGLAGSLFVVPDAGRGVKHHRVVV